MTEQLQDRWTKAFGKPRLVLDETVTVPETANATETSEATDGSKPMSKRQSYAVFLAGKVDVRGLGLTRDECSGVLDNLNNPETHDMARAMLLEMGATDKRAPRDEGATDGRGGSPAPDNVYVSGTGRGNVTGESTKRGNRRSSGKKSERALSRKQMYPRIYGDARLAGVEAGEADGLSDRLDGAALVNIKSGNSGFARWMVDNGHAERDEFRGGVSFFVTDHDGSYARSRNHADAFVAVLVSYEIKAQSVVWMD